MDIAASDTPECAAEQMAAMEDALGAAEAVLEEHYPRRRVEATLLAVHEDHDVGASRLSILSSMDPETAIRTLRETADKIEGSLRGEQQHGDSGLPIVPIDIQP